MKKKKWNRKCKAVEGDMAYPVMENTLFYSNCFDDFPVF